MNVGIIDRIALKPHAPLCLLFYLGVIDLMLLVLKFPMAQ